MTKWIYWNIEGINKIKNKDILNFLRKYELIILVETWCEASKMPDIIGYEYFVKEPNKMGEIGRKSGGIVIYYGKDLGYNMQLIKNNVKEGMWVLLKIKNRKFLLCVIYNPPKYSKYENKDFFAAVKTEILNMEYKYADADLIIVGDLNGRVGEIQEWDNENETKYGNIRGEGIGYELENRKNEDKEVNEFGRKIINLCKELELIILNGRRNGNANGEYTYISENGRSAIDLVILKPSLYEENIMDMKISETVESCKHFAIEMLLKAVDEKIISDENVEYFPLEIYKWKQIQQEQFRNQIDHKDVELWTIGIEECIRRNEVTLACNLLESLYKRVGRTMKVEIGTRCTERKMTGLMENVEMQRYAQDQL